MWDPTQSGLLSSVEMTALRAHGSPSCKHEQSQIHSLFHGGNVLITGATGFVGKVLIEALLRKTTTEKIYILVRAKKNRSTEERMKDILNDVVFQKLKNENPVRMSAIKLVSGDCSLQGLGLNNTDKDMLLNEVNIIFHSAATLKFNENLKVATDINVTGTKMLLDISRKMQNLKVIIYVSTAYSNVQFNEILETIYPVKEELNLIQLMNSIDYETASKITKDIIGDSPNTYVFTKRITEDMIQRNYSELPIGIFRPAIIIGAKEEPLPGYVDNLYGPTGLASGIMSGIVHCILIASDAAADLVPVDYVVNCLIATAWETYSRFVMNHSYNNIPVYNFVPYTNFPVTWGKLCNQVVESGVKAVPKCAIWYPFIFTVKSFLLYKIVTFVLHIIPAKIGDAIMKQLGKKPRWTHIYERTDELMGLLRPFCTRGFIFSNKNVQDLWKKLNKKDRELFPFCLENFNWTQYFDTYVKGIRIYVMKEKNEEKMAVWRSKKLWLFHNSLILSLISFWGGIVYFINYFLLKFIRKAR